MNSNLTDTLHALRTQAEADLEIAGKATEGPEWYLMPEVDEWDTRWLVVARGPKVGLSIGVMDKKCDANLVAHSRTALPASAAAVIRLTRALEAVCNWIDHEYPTAIEQAISALEGCSCPLNSNQVCDICQGVSNRAALSEGEND